LEKYGTNSLERSGIIPTHAFVRDEPLEKNLAPNGGMEEFRSGPRRCVNTSNDTGESGEAARG